MRGEFTGMALSAIVADMAFDLAETAMDRIQDKRSESPRRQERSSLRRTAPEEDRWAASCVDRIAWGLGQREHLPGTIYKYLNVLKHFMGWLGGTDVGAVTSKQVDAFLVDRAAAGLDCGALRVDLAALRTMLDKVLDMDVTRHLSYSPPPPPTAGLDEAVVQRLLDDADDARDKLLVLLANVLDLRSGEIASLRFSDFRVDEHVLIVRHEEKGKSLLVEVPEQLMSFVRELGDPAEPDSFLFHRPRDRLVPVSVRALQKRLRRLADKQQAQVTVRDLRSTPAIIQESAEDDPAKPERAGTNARSSSNRGNSVLAASPAGARRTLRQRHSFPCFHRPLSWKMPRVGLYVSGITRGRGG